MSNPSSVQKNNVRCGITNDLKSFASESQKVDVEEEYVRKPTLNVLQDENCSSDLVYTSRSGRKRKPKIFDDFETEYQGFSKRKQLENHTDFNIGQDEIVQYSDTEQNLKFTTGLKNTCRNELTDREGNSVLFLCPVCNDSNEDIDTIQRHIKYDHDEKMLSWVVLSAHYGGMKNVHMDPASHVRHGQTRCSTCMINYHSTEGLKLHMNKCHTYYPFCCGICRLAYQSIDAARLHMRKIHLKGLVCIHCSKNFQSQKALNQHCNKAHPEAKLNVEEFDKATEDIDREENKACESKTKLCAEIAMVEDTACIPNVTVENEGIQTNTNEASVKSIRIVHNLKVKEKQNNKSTELVKDNCYAKTGKVTNIIIQNSKKDEISKGKSNQELSVQHEHNDRQFKEYYSTNKEIMINSSAVPKFEKTAVKIPHIVKSVRIVQRSKLAGQTEYVQAPMIKTTPQAEECSEDKDKSNHTEMEYIDLDEDLSNTDTDENDIYFEDEKTNQLSHTRQKKGKSKKLQTQKMFDFLKLRDVAFKCLFEDCGEVFQKFQVWVNHIEKHKQKRKRPPFQCMECNYSTQDKKILSQHLLIKHKELNTVEIQMKNCDILKIKTNTQAKIIACVFCGFTDELGNFYEQHVCVRKKLNFYCPFCPKKSKLFETLHEHIKDDHSDKKVHRPEMGDKYQSLRTSKHDPAFSIEKSDTTCKDCAEIFDSNEMLKMHVNSKHAIFPYSCGVCRQCYGRRSAVLDHMKKTHSLPFTCEVCQRGFGDKGDLRRHETVHQKTKPFQCDFCGSRYADDKGLRSHYRHKHPGSAMLGKISHTGDGDSKAQVLICEVCGLVFDTVTLYRKHAKIHDGGEKEHRQLVKCEICGKEVFKKALDKHMCTKLFEGNDPAVLEGYSDTVKSIQEIFQKIKKSPKTGSSASVRCGLCNKEFNKNKYMFNHIRQIHLPKEGRKHRCAQCGAGFTGKSQLILHTRSHTHDKPYRCRICAKSFRQLGHIRVHLLSHSKEAHFQCKLCKNSFKSKCTLANHVLKHCDIFPYKCFVMTCKKAFNTLPNLLVHVRRCVSRVETEGEFQCKICLSDIDSLKSGVSHMKSHGKDLLYRCNVCSQDFLSYRKLYHHKDTSDHFTQSELEQAEKQGSLVQTFKCIEVNGDIGVLQTMYDYTPDGQGDHPGEQLIEPSYGQGVDCSDVEETVVDNGIETDDLMDIAEQLTHMADGKESRSSWEKAQDDLQKKCLNVTNDVQEENSGSQSNIKTMCQEEVIQAEVFENDIDTENRSCTVHSGNSEEIEDRVIYSQSSNITAIKAAPLPYKIISSHPVIDENAVLVEENSEIRICVESSTDVKLDINTDSHAHEHYEDPAVGTNVISEEMLASSTILDERGTELKVNVINDQGLNVPIQSNPELLQTFLTTGNYTLHLPSFDSNTEHAPQVSAFKENAEVEILSKLTSADGFENLDFNIQNTSELHVINEFPQVREYKYALEVGSALHTYDTDKKKSVTQPKNRKIVNTDKVFGEIVDKDAKAGNMKMENGEVNYKVRLHYYEDRSKQEEQFPLKCDDCPSRFRRVKDLNHHKKTHLPDHAKPYQCEQCSKGYITKHSYVAHMRTHTGERPHKCSQCEKAFRQLGHLQTHLRTHANYRPFKCVNCDKTFVTNSQLKQHLQSYGSHFQHSVENGFICPVCKNVFSSEKDLNIHRLKHLDSNAQEKLLGDFNMCASETKERIKDKKVQDTAKSKLMCDVCGKMFKWPSMLKYHAAIHLTGPKFKCNHCNSEFVSQSLLQAHIYNVHSMEQWQCHMCGQQLKSKKSFKNHMKSHNAPQFQCSNCEKKFMKKYLFLQHLPVCLGNSFEETIEKVTEQVND